MDTIGSRRGGPDRRDYFIGCALQGLIHAYDVAVAHDALVNKAIEIGTQIHTQLVAAEDAPKADA